LVTNFKKTILPPFGLDSLLLVPNFPICIFFIQKNSLFFSEFFASFGAERLILTPIVEFSQLGLVEFLLGL